jgi:hypothetical protein
VRVLQSSGEQYLALEALDIDTGGKIRGEHFDHDATPERAFLREKHATHPTAAELSFQEIGVAQGGPKLILKIGLQALNVRRIRSREEEPIEDTGGGKAREVN